MKLKRQILQRWGNKEKHKSHISMHNYILKKQQEVITSKIYTEVRNGETHGNGCDRDDEERKVSLCGFLWLRRVRWNTLWLLPRCHWKVKSSSKLPVTMLLFLSLSTVYLLSLSKSMCAAYAQCVYACVCVCFASIQCQQCHCPFLLLQPALVSPWSTEPMLWQKTLANGDRLNAT